MRAWIVAAVALLGGAASVEALETLHQRDLWVTAFEPGAAAESEPFCILARIGEGGGGRSLSISVFAADRAVVAVTNGAWALEPPEGPFELRLDGARWTLNWTGDGATIHAPVEDAAALRRLREALAGAAAASFRDRAGRPILELPLQGGAPAFAALDACGAERLGGR